jgi:hypothetical protein
MDSTDFGESIRQASAYSAATEYVGGNQTDEMDSKIVGGNSRIIRALHLAIGKQHVDTKDMLLSRAERSHGRSSLGLAGRMLSTAQDNGFAPPDSPKTTSPVCRRAPC